MFSVDVFLVTIFVTSNTGMLFPPVRTCLTYSSILKPCSREMINYGTLTGMVRVTQGRVKQTDTLILDLTIHHLSGRVLFEYPQVRSRPCTDDGYTEVKLSVSLQVLSEIKTSSRRMSDFT